MSLELVLPLPVNLANARLHWRTKHRKQTEYYATLDQLQLVGSIPPPPKTPFARATITATLYVAQMMDQGNAMHRAEKWPCDWLKTRGYIVDDNPACLSWTAIPTQHIDRKHPRLALTLSPL